MKIVIASATEKEMTQLKDVINLEYSGKDIPFNVSFFITGVGILSSVFSISKLIFEHRPGLIIQAGIAGAFDKKEALGKVVIVKEEILADVGVEEDGSFKDIFDMNFLSKNFFPFSNKRLINPEIEKLNVLQLESVTGITINEVTTRLQRIEQLKAKYNAAIESMEGAALHYCCLQTSTPFIQIRALSNYIGERDKSKWVVTDALKNLTNVVLCYIDKLYKNY